jgi:predicted transcriptional regulator
MTTKVSVHVGERPEGSGQRFINAWRRAEQGEAGAESHLSFESWELLARTLTPKRLALLRHIHRHPATSIAALARMVGRDYKRVHEDVELLTAAGLVERSEGQVRADYDEIRATIAL